MGTWVPVCAPRPVFGTWGPSGRRCGPRHVPGRSNGAPKLAGTPWSGTRMRIIPRGLGFRVLQPRKLKPDWEADLGAQGHPSAGWQRARNPASQVAGLAAGLHTAWQSGGRRACGSCSISFSCRQFSPGKARGMWRESEALKVIFGIGEWAWEELGRDKGSG